MGERHAGAARLPLRRHTLETLTITIAGQQFTIQPLTVGQLQDLHVGVVEPVPEDPAEGVRKFWARSIGIISTALSVDHPNMTPEMIGKLRLGTLTSVKRTVDDILDFAGIVEKKKDPKPGEAQAAE